MSVRLFLPKTEYGHTGTGLARGLSREYRGTGCESPTQKRHCKVYVLSDGAAARSLAGAGKALRKERAFAPHTESGYSVPIFSPAFPAERMRVHKNVCTEAFVALVLFYCDFRSRTAPILYCVKNDMLCSWNGNNSQKG